MGAAAIGGDAQGLGKQGLSTPYELLAGNADKRTFIKDDTDELLGDFLENEAYEARYINSDYLQHVAGSAVLCHPQTLRAGGNCTLAGNIQWRDHGGKLGANPDRCLFQRSNADEFDR